MSTHAFWTLSACELIAGYSAHRFSPCDVVDELLERIDAIDTSLHAFLSVDPDTARAAARVAERQWMSSAAPGPLAGVPISVKDTIEMAGMPTTYGSMAFRDNVVVDSGVVSRLREAGAVLFGKTNSPEFALIGAVRNRLAPDGRNPWDLDRTCGGSSGGSAAAVAAGLGPISIGTDARGSIRQPAAYNGVVGFKPTFGVVPVVQQWRAAPLRSHIGPLARTVGDLRLVMSVIAGADERDPVSVDLRPSITRTNWTRRRVGLVVSDENGVDDGARTTAALEAAELLGAHGFDVVPAVLPVHPSERASFEPTTFPYAPDHLAAVEAMRPNFMRHFADDLTDYARPIYERGASVTGLDYRRRLIEDVTFRARIWQWFNEFDLVVTPACSPAPMLDAAGQEAEFTFLKPWNASHNPAAVVPWTVTPEGVPIGVQVVGRCHEDALLLDTLDLLEGARPWRHQWPDISYHS